MNEVLAGNHCVDEETEALTQRGWVNGWDLTTDDTILAVDHEGSLRWSPVHGVFRNPDYDGPMHRLRGSIDALVSPGHKFMLTDGSLVPVEQLKWNNRVRITGTALESTTNVYADAFVEVAGWAVTEGNFRVGVERTHPYRKPATLWVRISQKPGPKAERIETALKRSGAQYRVGRTGRQGRVLTFDVAGDVARELHRIAPGRVLSHDFMLSLSADQRVLLINTMIDGDGYRTANQQRYVQGDPAHMDAFEMLCAMSGFVTYRKRRVPPVTTGDYRNAKPYLETNIQMRPRPMHAGSLHRNGNWTQENYRGLLWCPTTDHGTWMCRRGGRVYLTGNTLLAARDLGWETVAVTFVDVDDDQAARIVVMDNRSAELASNDDELLAGLLADLPDLDGTGYRDDEFEALQKALAAEQLPPVGDTDPDEIPEPPPEPHCQPGDVWELGPHRLVVGDSTDVGAWDALLAGEKADAMWTDPPYGVSYQTGMTKEEAKRLHRRTDGLEVSNDTLTEEGLADFLRGALGAALAACKGGAVWYVAAPSGTASLQFSIVLNELQVWRQTLVWVKDVFAFGRSDYHYRHETVFYGWVPGAAHHAPPDRKQDTVHEIARPKRSEDHPTMKPVELIQLHLSNSTDALDIVVDPFGGSGSTLIACHQLNRKARLIELDARYADVICRRFQELSGTKPTRDGEPHDFTKATDNEAAQVDA